MLPWWLLVLGLSLPFCVSGADFVSSITLTASEIGTVDGQPAAYFNQPFNLIATVAITDTALVTTKELRITLVTPGSSYTTVSCSISGTDLTGNPVASGCTNYASYKLFAMVDHANIRYSVGAGLQMQAGWSSPTFEDTQDTDGRLEVTFGTIYNVTEGLTAEDYEVILYFDNVYLIDKVRDNDFTVSAEVLQTTSGQPYNVSNFVMSIRYMGPALLFTVSSSASSGIQAQDSVTYTVSMQHSSFSTEAAADVQVQLYISNPNAVSLQTGGVSWNGGSQIYITSISDVISASGNFAIGDTLQVSVTFITNDLIPLHSSITLSGLVSYKASGIQNKSMSQFESEVENSSGQSTTDPGYGVGTKGSSSMPFNASQTIHSSVTEQFESIHDAGTSTNTSQSPPTNNITHNATGASDQNSHTLSRSTVRQRYHGSSHKDLLLMATDSQSVSTATVNFATQPGDSGWDSILAVGQTVNLIKGFTMPLGTLYLEFEADFYSYSLEEIPISADSSDLSHPTGVAVSGGSEGFDTNSRRRRNAKSNDRAKRQASPSLNIKKDFGTITNPSSGGLNSAPLTLKVDLSVLDPSGPGGSMTVDTYLNINGDPYSWDHVSSTINKPILSINKTAQMENDTLLPNSVRFNVTVSHSPLSSGPAYDVTLKDGHKLLAILWGADREGPGPGDSGFTVTNNVLWSWMVNTLNTADEMFSSLASQPLDDGVDFPDGISYYNATVTYKSGTGSGAKKYTQTAPCCIQKERVLQDNMFTNYGYTVLAVICGILIGMLLIILILCILVVCCRRWLFSDTVHVPESVKYDRLNTVSSKSLIVESEQIKNFVMKSPLVGRQPMKDISSVSEGDSIVKVLCFSDKQKMMKEFDILDIKESSHIEEEIESEYENDSIRINELLLRNMEKNGDVKNDVVTKSVNNFRRAWSDHNKKLDKEYKDDLARIYADLANKNKQKLRMLMTAEEEKKKQMAEKLKVNSIPVKEQKEVMKSLNEEIESEREELNNLLLLEQEEKVEELRKKYHEQNHLALKNLQQNMLNDVKEQGNLNQLQAEWLMQEYQVSQSALDQLHREEMKKQRMVLEEKRERRRLMAEAKVVDEQHVEDVVDSYIKQDTDAVKKLEREREINGREAAELIHESKEQIMLVKKKMADEKEKQASDLQKRLSKMKKKKLEEQAKKHKQELKELEQTQQSLENSSSYTDPLAPIEKRLTMISNQMTEMSSLENEIDKEDAKELNQLNEEITLKLKHELENINQNIMKDLEKRGLDEDQMNKIINKHKKQRDKLEKGREKSKKQQYENLKASLERHRKAQHEKQEKELREQEQIKEQEERVYRKLVENQVSMSDEERDKIMREHEKNMVMLQNSLTLNKIKQKRMLEERVAKKRAQNMERLQKQQQAELKKKYKQAGANSDLDDEERLQIEIEMLKKQAAERIEVIKGTNIEMEEDIEEIEFEMLENRKIALKEQEERLGAMLAELQMSKAKEMTQIEEQQKAIHNLKSNLLDDLNEKGILSDPECQRVINVHQENQLKLANKLEKQRARQEKALRKRLDLRLKQTEESMNADYEEKLAKKSASSNTLATRMWRVAAMDKYQLELRQLRNRMESEIRQLLQEMRRQHEIHKMKAIEEESLQFINGLVILGKFKGDDLEKVIAMLFPTKSEEERKELLHRLMENYVPHKYDSDTLPDDENGPSTLEERVKSATYGQRINQEEMSRSRSGKRASMNSGRRKQATLYEEDEESGEHYLRERPEPVGRSYTPEYGSDEELERRPPPSRLPPMSETTGKKKKRGRRNSKVVPVDNQDYY